METSAPADQLPRVICVGGPTGSGKTALAIALAAELNGEIVNADSRQIFAEFPVITAQPGLEEKRQTRHYLYGFLPPDYHLCAMEWAEKAAEICHSIIAAGKLPILVGGTGFYFESFLSGLAPMPQIPPEIRTKLAQALAAHGPEELHEQLAHLDPAFAAKIHPHDSQRILRGLEVYEASGRPISFWHLRQRRPFARGLTLILNPALERLTPRLLTRIELMLEQGAREEMERAMLKHPGLPRPGFSSIGCLSLKGLICGELTLDQCMASWLSETRAYAKRQLTWFRGRGKGIMLDSDDPLPALLAAKHWLTLEDGP